MKFTPHPKASKKVIRIARQVKRETGDMNYREVARRLDVNVKYVYQNLTAGIEPPMSNVDVRGKMGLKTGIKKPRSPYAIMPRWYARDEQTLARYLKLKANIKKMVDETRMEQYKFRRKR